MKSIQWFEIMKEAVTQTEIELEAPQIDHMILLHLNDKVQSFSIPVYHEKAIPSSLLGQAWNFLTKILTNELRLENWNSLTVKGRKKAFTLFSLGFNVVLIIFYDTLIDPMDVLKTLMKYVFVIGYKDIYGTVGLIASDGFPVWVTFPEGQETDEFLFAISITSLMTLVERIDMEVSAGGVRNCIIQGTEDLLLNVSFNPSQDLALAVTQQSNNISDVFLKVELDKLFQKVVDPVIYSAIVPEIVDEDRERMLKQILEDVTGEATEEEIQTLNIFDSLTLQTMENEIKLVQKRYGTNEISVGYLRRRMSLPSEVLSMSLEYLIANGNIRGKIGKARQTGQEILVIDLSADMSQLNKRKLRMIQTQINDLFVPINPFLKKLPKIEQPIDTQEVITEALSEFQVMLTLSDTDSIFLIANDIRFNESQLENAVKTAIMLRTQISETDKDDIIFAELKRRYSGTTERIQEIYPTIKGQAKKFHEDLLNSYRLLSRLLPIPTHFRQEEDTNKDIIVFKCFAHNCEDNVEIEGNIDIWVKLGIFSTVLGIEDDFPEGASPLVEEFRNKFENQFTKLVSLVKNEIDESKLEYFPFLENIEELLLNNSQRDEIIASLRQGKVENKQEDFFSLFKQCKSCNNWFCEDHLSSANKCIYC